MRSTESTEASDGVQLLTGLPEQLLGVLDALPVERFEIRDGSVLQHRVRSVGDAFATVAAPAPTVLDAAVPRVPIGVFAWHAACGPEATIPEVRGSRPRTGASHFAKRWSRLL